MANNGNPNTGKGLIRSLNRRGARGDKSPLVAQKRPAPKEPTVCDRCGAVYSRKTWRQSHRVTGDFLTKVNWGICPACEQVKGDEYYGRVILREIAGGPAEKLAAIRSRIENTASRAGYTQPEHRLVSISPLDGDIEVLTTSQKLAHRIAHEIVKAFGGRATYSWSDDDGSLFATWRP
jgi:NMD protein affecting ribosome stability and mRNA decay